MSYDRENPPAPAKPGSRLYRLAKNLLVLVASTSVALLLAELVIRLVAPQGLSAPSLESFHGLQVQRANLNGTDEVPGLFSVTYHTNSQRFRGREDYPLQPPAGVTRVITIGDSFCFGVGAEDHEAYPAILEELLSAAGQKAEVINAGVSGTGAGSQALWYDMAVARFNPRVVVLSVFVNDIDDDLATPMFTLDTTRNAVPMPLADREKRVEKLVTARKRVNSIPGYAFLAEHSHLVNIVRRIASLSMDPQKPVPKSDEQARKYHERYLAEGVPLFKAELKWLNQRVQSSGARLVVAWFPTRETIYPDTGPGADHSRWQARALIEALADFSARENVPLLDPTPAFKAKATTPGELFFKGADRHARPAGYRLFADEVASFLLNRS
jgi:lysophospholipase L1-like esterase